MSPARLRRLFPFLSWIRVDRRILLGDLVAGITAALLAILQSLACSTLAGVPACCGRYAASVGRVA